VADANRRDRLPRGRFRIRSGKDQNWHARRNQKSIIEGLDAVLIGQSQVKHDCPNSGVTQLVDPT